MKKLAGYIVLVGGLILGMAFVVFPAAVTQIAGLAVAQSSTKWNSLKDMAFGDANSSGSGLFTPCLWNGVTCDRARGSIANGQQVDVTRIGGATTPSDAFANPTTTNVLWVLNSLFNGTTWDRMRSSTADDLASTGLMAAVSTIFDGTNYDRERSASADNLAAVGIPSSGNMGFDGSTFDRTISVSNTNNTATTSQGARYYAPLSTWSQTNTPATNTIATSTKEAGGGTVRHVLTGYDVCVADNTLANSGAFRVNFRDGATGAGTILKTVWVGISIGTFSANCVALSGLNITGSANTAMTVEFVAAAGVGTNESVNFTGYSTP